MVMEPEVTTYGITDNLVEIVVGVIEEGQIIEKSTGKRKRMKRKGRAAAAPPEPITPKSYHVVHLTTYVSVPKGQVDEEGFTKVVRRKSPTLGGKPAILKRLQ